MKKPLHQQILISIFYILVGIGAFGGLLDSFVNSISLINEARATKLTLTTLLIWPMVEVYLRFKPMDWVNNGQLIRIRGLGWGRRFSIIGVLLLLWVPSIIGLPPSKPIPAPSPSPETKRFHVNIRNIQLMSHRSPYIYIYNSMYGQLGSPIGMMAYVEVVNLKPLMANVNSYMLDIDVNAQWKRLYHLSAIGPLSLYFALDDGYKECVRIHNEKNAFDIRASAKGIQPGEKLEGWMYFEWPLELRKAVPRIGRLQMHLESSTGEKESHIINFGQQSQTKAGEGSLGNTFLEVEGKKKTYNLSRLKIVPRMDFDQLKKDPNSK